MSDIIKDIKARDLTKGQQRTALWKNMRKNFVGGTNISNWISRTFSPVKCIVQHLAGTSFTGNHATRWGTIFEDLASILFEKLFGSPQTHLGFIAHPIGGVGCSPDGIIMLQHKGKDKVFIIEYKSPITTIPSGVIPKQYVNQVQLGLMVLDQCDATIFVNNMFRKCSQEQFADNGEIDATHAPVDADSKPLAFGIAEIYLSDKISDKISDKELMTQQEIEFFEELEKKYKKQEAYDFGEGDVTQIFSWIERGILTIRFDINNIIVERFRTCSEFVRDMTSPCPMEQKQIDELYTSSIDTIGTACPDKKLVGIMPWKLFKSDVILIDRDPDFAHRVLNIHNHITTMNKISKELEPIVNRVQFLHTLRDLLTKQYPNNMPCSELEAIIEMNEMTEAMVPNEDMPDGKVPDEKKKHAKKD